MLALWKARQGRKAAVAAIGPLVERSRWRLSEIPDAVWLHPYMVGFLGMLITMVARRASPTIGDAALGLAQSEAWASMTGLRSDLFGEEMLHLSLTRNAEFGAGCRNAHEVFLALFDDAYAGEGKWEEALLAEPAVPAEAHPDLAKMPESSSLATEELWRKYFEAVVRGA